MAKKNQQSSKPSEVNGEVNDQEAAVSPDTDEGETTTDPTQGQPQSDTAQTPAQTNLAEQSSKDVAATPASTAASTAAPAAAATPAAAVAAPVSLAKDSKREPFITEEMRTIFGFSQDEADEQNEMESYLPPEGADVKFPIGRLLTSIILIALCVVGYIFGSQALREKEYADAQDRAEIEAAHRRQRPQPKMYGTLKITSSEPHEAYVLLEGKQIYTSIEISDPADPTGKQKRKAWTEMRAKRSTTVQNLRITDEPIKFTLRAEGFDDYLLVLHMPAWKPLDNEALKGEFEKNIGYVELDPREAKPIFTPPTPDPKTVQPGQSLAAPPQFTFDRERQTRTDYVSSYYYKPDPTLPVPKPGSPEAALPPPPPRPVLLSGRLTIDADPGEALVFINSDPLYLPIAIPDPLNPGKMTLSCDYVAQDIVSGGAQQTKTVAAGQPALSFDKYCFQRRIRRIINPATPPGGVIPPGGVTPPGGAPPNPLLAPPNPLAPAPTPVPAPAPTPAPADGATTAPVDGVAAAPAEGEPKTELVIQWEVKDVSFYDSDNRDGETYSVRLEWPNQPKREPYLTNILPRQWQCTPAPADQFEARFAEGPVKIEYPPTPPGELPPKPIEDVYHMLCDYSFMVKFNHNEVDAFRPPVDKDVEGAEAPPAAPAAP